MNNSLQESDHTMDETLEHVFSELASAVPTAIATPETEHEFSAATLPVPPERLTTEQMYIGMGTSSYDEFLAFDKVIFFADKATLRQLALLILAVVFHPERKTVRVTLTHPVSVIPTLLISCEGQPFSRWEILETRAISYTYSPAEVRPFPWMDLPLSPYELPCFYLRSDPSQRSAPAHQSLQQPDTVAGFGSDRGCARLAELLLNLGRPENTVDDIALEVEAGWRGVGRKSVEARFALPGSGLWDPAQWPPQVS